MTLAGISEWGLAGAFCLGVVAALHPCPLSTLAGALLLVLAPADSHVPGGGRFVWRAGALVLGMVIALALVATLIGGSMMQARFFSIVIPNILRPFLPPLLIVAGILQTGVFNTSRGARTWTATERWLKSGFRSAPRMFAFGIVLALSFCPATAGLFFGVLIPLATTYGQPATYALAYAVGYGLPILTVAVCLGAGVRFDSVRRYASAGSALSGWGLIAIGTWLTWKLLITA
jgi:cytochrome c-type biogenesis protein